MSGIHGGDIYRNQVKLDYSVNINPLGMPEGVEEALHAAVKKCYAYPDPEAAALKQAVSRQLGVPETYLAFGNGASELFLAILHGVKPEKVLIPVPSFYGYEHAAAAAAEHVIYYPLQEAAGFSLQEDFMDALTEEISMIFLTNPNNPTGKRISKETLYRVLNRCREKEILVVLDECFIEFCEEGASMLPALGRYDNLIIVRAFTKIYAIPGVRLGYLLCSNQRLCKAIKRQLPEWNLSVFAQESGVICAGQELYRRRTVAYVKQERDFLLKGLSRLGLHVYEGEANFILVYTERPLYDILLQKGILIRDCSNFRGLSKGFYRLAVKTRQENEMLLSTLEADWR